MFINKKAQNELSLDKLGMPLCIKYTVQAEIYSKGVLSHKFQILLYKWFLYVRHYCSLQRFARCGLAFPFSDISVVTYHLILIFFTKRDRWNFKPASPPSQ